MTEDAIGIAGRLLRDPQIATAERAAFRSAVKRVGRKDQAAAAEPGVKPRRRGAKAAQAALGMMDKPPGRSSEAELKAWLESLKEEERKRLSKLLWTVRQDRGETGAGMGKVERALEAQGIRFDIHGQNVTVNVTTQGGAGGKSRENAWRPRSRPLVDWGRAGSKFREFVNGH